MPASNQTFIVAAYAVTWIAILGYAFRLARASARARAAYDTARRGGAGPGAR